MRGDIEELALGQGEGTRGVQSTPAPVEVVGWRARGPRDPKRLGRSSPSPRSGHGWENSISNLTVVFQLQKEMRRGCVSEFVCDCLPRRASRPCVCV